MSKNGVAALSFLHPRSTMNETKYVQNCSQRAKTAQQVCNCQIFMQEGAPLPPLQIAKNFLDKNTSNFSSDQETVRTLNPLRISGHL